MTAKPLLFAAMLGLAGCAGPAPRDVAATAVPVPSDSLCLRETGSRIRPLQGECLPVIGRAYTRVDLERTGAPSLSEALRSLAPTFR